MLVPVLLAAVLSGTAAAAVAAPDTAGGRAHAAADPRAGARMALFAAAAREFGVPVRVLLAVSYNESRWQPHGASPSVDGGYGLMDLTTPIRTRDTARGIAARPERRAVGVAKSHYTLDEAVRLLHVSAEALKISDRENVRGAAAVLASYARRLGGGRLPSGLDGWYAAVAEYSGDTIAQTAQSFADDVFSTLRDGASLVTLDGQTMRLPAMPGLRPVRGALLRLGLKPAAAIHGGAGAVDCPPTLNCSFVPAAYAQDDPSHPTNYGDYDLASRPSDMKIDYIIIHDTEGSYDSAISTFQDPASYVSANYVIRSSDGAITEMVRPGDVAWGAGDWYVNMHAINIEHEGFAAQGATWYTEAMYRSSATLVRYLAHEYGIPLDRAHILGHDNLPGPTDHYTAAQHWDPGPYWDWNHYMALLQGVSDQAERAADGGARARRHHVVTISPAFASNQPPVTDCSSGTCVTLPAQPASFVYLRTAPSASAPLLSDPILHPGGSPGTLKDSDWSDKAPAGATYAIAGQEGDWTGIWYGGHAGWFYNPPGMLRTARFSGGVVITPRPGRTSIPVYGSAYPEASAYPPAVPAPAIAPLSYTIPAGQEYVTSGQVPDDYYYAVTVNSSLPDDHTVIHGQTVYYQISFNHREFFVKASDVLVDRLR
jgi:N-acetyl-anhydromuramyl-L-alanine amidase AmpD